MEKHLEKAKRAREQEDKWLGVQNNLAVYVTGLPDDTTEAEFAQVPCPPRAAHRLSRVDSSGHQQAAACQEC